MEAFTVKLSKQIQVQFALYLRKCRVFESLIVALVTLSMGWIVLVLIEAQWLVYKVLMVLSES